MSALFVRLALLGTLGLLCTVCVEGLQPRKRDWVLFPHKVGHPTKVITNEDGSVVLTNGIISRQFVVQPNWCTIDIRHQVEDYSFFRGLTPEAIVEITNFNNLTQSSVVNVGNCLGQERFGFFSTDFFNLSNDASAYQYVGYSVQPITARWSWKPVRHAENLPWPPKGVQLEVTFAPPKNASAWIAHTVVKVIYQMFDGCSTYSKYVQVLNSWSNTIRVDKVVMEQIRVREYAKNRIYIETDYMPRHDWESPIVQDQSQIWYPSISAYGFFANTPMWTLDPEYEQGNDRELRGDLSMTYLFINATYLVGPQYALAPQRTFETFHTYFVLYDTDDVQRQSLERNIWLRLVSPQTTENTPIFYASDCSDDNAVYNSINQTAAAGLEMLICAPFSGFDPTISNMTQMLVWKEYADYAHSLDVLIGGYVCMQGLWNSSSEVLLPFTGWPNNGGQVACFATNVMTQAMERIKNFIRVTGIDMIETDCPFEATWCNGTDHYHYSYVDSQTMQYEIMIQFYQDLRDEFGLWINSPDPYELASGTNRRAIGYTDAWMQLPLGIEEMDYGRMYVSDGLYHFSPSAAWIAGPYFDRLFPLNGTNLFWAEWMWAMYQGQGILANNQGYELYDTPEGLALAQKYVGFYKTHRKVLNKDVVHIRRPDARSYDCMVHVDPDVNAPERALGWVFNPTSTTVRAVMSVPLYYANFSMSDSVVVWRSDLSPAQHTYTLDDIYSVDLALLMEPYTFFYFIVTAADQAPLGDDFENAKRAAEEEAKLLELERSSSEPAALSDNPPASGPRLSHSSHNHGRTATDHSH